MKTSLTTITVALALLLSSFSSFAQSMADVLTKPDVPLTWLGLDFSEAKYVGDPGTVAPEEMKDLFTKINTVVLQEADKYDVAKAFKRSGSMPYKIEVTEAVNEKIDAGQIITANLSEQQHFSAAKIQSMANKYRFPAGTSGVAVVFIVENISKPTEKESFWVTFVDTSSKKVLFTTGMSASGGGFGFRNHWARPVYDVLKEIKSSQYDKWKKQFAKGK
ncbi:hypothetical protein Q5H93_13750 [Hymenobacter sp. ASUV-10]|uniref:DUF4136 domain-containing protein n=1 Tax=Hymenobacter aranciens TaxID=3063996 RepID=A0ABT9BFI8_9BACT|nr:hypothetical protein [Hymenobacter sp. ASUV-10]MDO7875802.1 hypothetical protein [Hymenobacter sp. ASUV-10]